MSSKLGTEACSLSGGEVRGVRRHCCSVGQHGIRGTPALLQRHPGKPLHGVCKQRAHTVETHGTALNGAVTTLLIWDLHHSTVCSGNSDLSSLHEQGFRASLGAGWAVEMHEVPACVRRGLSRPCGVLAVPKSPPVTAVT